jgi:hypothetical protein
MRFKPISDKKAQPLQADVQALHGLVSCAEWTGVKLSTLLDETGIDPQTLPKVEMPNRNGFIPRFPERMPPP